MVVASRCPSRIFGKSTSSCGSRRVSSTPLSKNMGVSQCESRVSTCSCTRLAVANCVALATKCSNSGIMQLSPSGQKHSGCHCTPMILFMSVLSIASTTPSAERAVTLKRGPGSPTAWWWKELTAKRVPSSRPTTESASAVTKCVATPRSASCECLTRVEWGIAVAMSCITVPPSAAASTCMPRQMPSMGTWRL